MNAIMKMNTYVRKDKPAKPAQINKDLLIKKGVIRY